ncbi:MAG: response regulator [Rhodocyclales bacterium]|nr:response regulator [Rhodocyclales bacterium]
MLPTILIVDDEPANLALLRQILSPDYTLVYARCGKEALAAAAKHHPALVLLDIQMPDMDGYTVCRKLKAQAQTENIPVIFVTALAEIGDETAGFAAGGVDYIVKPVSPPTVRARVRTHLSLVSVRRLEKSYHDAIYMLGEASEFKDAETGSHIWRMAGYSCALAGACGWDATACEQMKLAAPLHDIGKLGIPDAVLNKPGRLDTGERLVMQAHTIIGYKILSESTAPILQMAATIALHHHEKWDGSGYPNGVSGEAIPEMARIVAIADVFDALSMTRSYKEGWPLERVIDTLTESAGTHFDPRLISHFTRILPEIVAIRDQWSTGKPDQNRAHAVLASSGVGVGPGTRYYGATMMSQAHMY